MAEINRRNNYVQSTQNPAWRGVLRIRGARIDAVPPWLNPPLT